MIRSIIVGALATVALAAAGPVLAKPGKGGGHGMSNPAKANKGKAKGRGDASMPAQRRQKSQGAAHASPRALERASANSVLHDDVVVAGPLTGLSVGSQVMLDNGRMGAVERIVPSSGRRVSNVLVRTSDGRIVPISPERLTLEGGMWRGAR